MAKNKTEIERVKPNFALPEFLQAEEPVGTEELSRHIIPPRVKIIQKQSSEELQAVFGVGDVILSPVNAVVAEAQRDGKGRIETPARFLFVPVFFFPEYCAWNPMSVRGSEPAIYERSLDGSSALARKARNPRTREEDHPTLPGEKLAYAEHLNFLIRLYNHPHSDQVAVMTFLRGSHSMGTSFCARIKMRRAPLFGCVFQATVLSRSNAMGEWFVLDCDNPPEGVSSPWVQHEEFADLKLQHETFAGLHRESKIQVDYEADKDLIDPSAAAESKEF